MTSPEIFNEANWIDEETGLPPLANTVNPSQAIDQALRVEGALFSLASTVPSFRTLHLGSGSLELNGAFVIGPIGGPMNATVRGASSGPRASVRVDGGHITVGSLEWVDVDVVSGTVGALGFTDTTINLGQGAQFDVYLESAVPWPDGEPTEDAGFWHSAYEVSGVASRLSFVTVGWETPVLGDDPFAHEPGDNLVVRLPSIAGSINGVEGITGFSFVAIPEPAGPLLCAMIVPLFAFGRRRQPTATEIR